MATNMEHEHEQDCSVTTAVAAADLACAQCHEYNIFASCRVPSLLFPPHPLPKNHTHVTHPAFRYGGEGGSHPAPNEPLKLKSV